MALRGKLYHCHLFSFAGPQTEGVISNWTQNLIPIDEDEVISGEKVQLYVAIDGRHHDLTDKSQIRFDLIEQDHFLTGGPDDLIVSLLGTGATQPDADFQTVQKETK